MQRATGSPAGAATSTEATGCSAGGTAGTGFLIGSDVVVTCSHVLQGSDAQRRGDLWDPEQARSLPTA